MQGTQQTKAASAPIRVSGTVTDENNEPLIGVYVRVKGGDASAITDVDGHFYLTVPDRNSVMQFSYVGFKKQEITVGKDISFNVVMKEDKTFTMTLDGNGVASAVKKAATAFFADLLDSLGITQAQYEDRTG